MLSYPEPLFYKPSLRVNPGPLTRPSCYLPWELIKRRPHWVPRAHKSAPSPACPPHVPLRPLPASCCLGLTCVLALGGPPLSAVQGRQQAILGRSHLVGLLSSTSQCPGPQRGLGGGLEE